MPTFAQKNAWIAEKSAAETAAMQQLLADMRAAEQELLAADAAANIDAATSPQNEAAGRG